MTSCRNWDRSASQEYTRRIGHAIIFYYPSGIEIVQGYVDSLDEKYDRFGGGGWWALGCV